MELKKNPKVDIGRKKWMLFSIGLAITMLFLVVSFEWKVYDKNAQVVVLEEEEIEYMMEDPPITQQPSPPPPVLQQPEVVEVPDEEEIDDEIEANMDIELKDIPTPAPPKAKPKKKKKPKVEEKEEEIFMIVEEQAMPKGGLKKFYKYISDNLSYPSQARRMGVEGRVFLQFVVEKDGSITDIKVLKGIGSGCDEEAVKVLKSAPKWKPGKQRGKAVRVRRSIPVFFKLQ